MHALVHAHLRVMCDTNETSLSYARTSVRVAVQWLRHASDRGQYTHGSVALVRPTTHARAGSTDVHVVFSQVGGIMVSIAVRELVPNALAFDPSGKVSLTSMHVNPCIHSQTMSHPC